MSEVVSSQPLVDAWLTDAAVTVHALGTDTSTGLTSVEAAARLARVGGNELEAEPTVPGWRRLIGQFADPLVILLVAAVGISLAVWVADGAAGVPFEAIVIGLMLLANGLLGYLQEARAEQAVAALQRIALEILCENLHEFDVGVTSPELGSIRALVRQYAVSDSYVDTLRGQVVPG